MAPEGAFVNEAGETVTGAVKVYLTPLDPSKEQDLAAYPGDLRATTAAGEMVQLETFGVLDVTVRKDGEELQVKEGASLTIRIPAPSGISNPPESVALWSFDEATALWREEGTATWLSADRVYEGEISHLSPWNADVPLEATCIKGTMQDDAGNPIPGAYVTGLGVDYSGASSATTGADGTFCMAVRKSSTVKVTALHPAGGATMREVSSGPGDTPVPPDCASQSCLRVGIWEVERSVVKLPDGSAVSCDSLQNPFAGTCAAGLMDLATCFHPAGTCTMEGAVSGSMQAVWENGSRLVWTVSTDGTSTGDMYSPEGTPCGTFEIEVDTSTGTSKQVVRGASGQSWSLETSQSGLVTVICTNGQRLSFPKAQLEAFTACTGGGGTSNEACTWEGGGTPGTPSMGPCETDADCTSPGQVCCTRTSIRLCMSKIVCDSMCRTSSDCTGGMTCCNADSGAGFCAPPSSCTE